MLCCRRRRHPFDRCNCTDNASDCRRRLVPRPRRRGSPRRHRTAKASPLRRTTPKQASLIRRFVASRVGFHRDDACGNGTSVFDSSIAGVVRLTSFCLSSSYARASLFATTEICRCYARGNCWVRSSVVQ